MIFKSIILIVIAVIVVGGAGAAAYVMLNDRGPGSDDSGQDAVLVEGDSYSYWMEDTMNERTTYVYTIMDVLGDSTYEVRTLVNGSASDSEMTYDEYVKVLFDELYYPDDTWTRGGTEALDKNTNFDGVDCVVWTKETSDHSYTSWIGVDDGVLYYNEDVITIDGESATSTYRLVTCTFIDKL